MKKVDKSLAIPSQVLIQRLRQARQAINDALAPFERQSGSRPVGGESLDLKPGDSVFVIKPANTHEWPGWLPDMEHLSHGGIYEIDSLHSCQIDMDSGRIDGLGVILDGEEHLLNANWLRKVGDRG